ncbi:WxL domain-containing protein [Vagococcus carniphilus]|uniref:WxL domain-containing protein n=1 Tax=Vagococcus carniphilus TaxID=218144 RepID=UPI003B5A2948
MKNSNLKFLVSSSLVLLSLVIGGQVLAAEDAKEMNQKGKVTVKSSATTEVVDPEKPEETEDPEEPGPSTKGDLRIDYVSPIDFGKVKLTDSNRKYTALATKIGKTTRTRGNFIQISDYREKSTGWSLQVKQETQFKTPNHDELTGAVLSLDKGWANSTSTSGAPAVTRDTLAINNIGEAYDVARATPDSGSGVWSIIFGASKDNDDNQQETVSKGKGDSNIRNSAVSITIPDSTKVVPKEYQTKITWILAETP